MAYSNFRVDKNQSALLRRYVKPYFSSVVLASFCSLALGILSSFLVSLIGPSLQVLMPNQADADLSFTHLLGENIGSLFSAIAGKNSINARQLVSLLPGLLLGVAGLKTLASFCQSYLWERTGELISKDMRHDTMQAYLHLDASVRKSKVGQKIEADLSSCITTDIKLIREYFVHFYGGFPRESLQLLFLTGVLLALSPRLFALFFLFVLPVVAIVNRLGKKLRKRASKALSDYSSLTEWLQQRLLGIETIKHYQTEEIEIAKFKDLTTSLYGRFVKAARIKSRTSPSIEMVGVGALVVVLYFALDAINQGNLSGSIAVSFFASLALVAQSGAMLGRYFNSNREGSAAIKRLIALQTFLFENQDTNKRTIENESEYIDDEIQFRLICRELSFHYPNSQKPALSNFSYSFEKNKIYCIVGPSGAGKSTLFQVILRLITPQKGKLIIPSAQGGPLPLTIGYMPQDMLLMSGTLAENVIYPESMANENKILDALEQVDLRTFIDTLPAGIHTQVGKEGLGLSGGQVQRVILSRLFYHHYPLILVDEGTSALDPEVEQVIYQGLIKLKNMGATVIMIAHRISATEIADTVLQLEDGLLVSSKNRIK